MKNSGFAIALASIGVLSVGCAEVDQTDSVQRALLTGTATASSAENNTLGASNAVDGKTTTRWSSAFADPQWLKVDLGSTQAIGRVVISWEAAYGKDYQIQVSDD